MYISVSICILSRPVPGVQWRRSDGKDISVRAQIRSFGLELYFAGIEYEDAGAYECDGFNKAATNPYKQTVSIRDAYKGGALKNVDMNYGFLKLI